MLQTQASGGWLHHGAPLLLPELPTAAVVEAIGRELVFLAGRGMKL